VAHPFGLAPECGHAVLRIAYLEQPNCALRALPGHIGEPTLGIRALGNIPNAIRVTGLAAEQAC
jgi:hypothetical protein